MILNNGWIIIGKLPSINYGNVAVDTGLPVMDIKGVQHTLVLPKLTDSSHDTGTPWGVKADDNPKQYLYNFWIRLGTGSTPPTLSNYCLENDVTSQLTSLKVTMNNTVTDACGIVTFTITGINPGGNTLAIREIGYGKRCTCDYNYETTGAEDYCISAEIMMIREVLDNPVFVHPGQGFTFTIEWKMA